MWRRRSPFINFAQIADDSEIGCRIYPPTRAPPNHRAGIRALRIFRLQSLLAKSLLSILSLLSTDDVHIIVEQNISNI